MVANEKQREAWNGSESLLYVEHADRVGRHLAPFTEAFSNLRSARSPRYLAGSWPYENALSCR